MILPGIRMMRLARDTYDMAVLHAFGEAVAARVSRPPEHFLAAGLQASDFRTEVTVRHHDQSVLVFRAAFYVTSGEHHAVFTEHLGYHVLHVEDVEVIGEEPL